MIKAVLFDVDGVLLDSDEKILDAFEKVGEVLNLKSPGRDFFRKRFGIPSEEIIPNAYGSSPEAIRLFKELDENMQVDIVDGVEEVLGSIKVKKGIVSTKDMKLIKKFLGGLIGKFDVVISGDDTEKHKPNPEPLLLACERLNVDSKDIVYIGDAMSDYQMAKNARAKFIGFVNGGATDDEFREAGAETIVHSMKELQNKLTELGIIKL
ncbi:HAD family hydrolase [archaeon]|nr:MAG: HAD family hydrolase [archaeon]